MLLKRIVPLLILTLIIMISLNTGCDKLVTEKITIIEAGHPIAEFDLDSGSVDTGCAPHTVSFIDKSVGPYDQLTWNFGDGESSTDTTPTHTYDSAGYFTVTLSIKDTETNGVDSEVKKRFVYVGASNAAFTVDNDSTCYETEIIFTPQIISKLKTYNWDFGDGSTSTDSTPVHSYDSSGTYWAHLSVTDYCGPKVDSLLITVAECPTIAIIADTTFGCVPLTVEFEDTSFTRENRTPIDSGKIWNFGNGETAVSGSIHTIEYDDPGVYTVKVTVSSSDGADYIGGTTVDSIIDFITVFDTLNANIGVLGSSETCKSRYQPFYVHFENLTTGYFDSLLWIFGDGDSSTTENPIHGYDTTGVFSVKLVAYSDNSDHCGSDSTIESNLVKVYGPLYDSTTYFSTRFDSVSTVAPIQAYYTFVDTSLGMIADWHWDFNDTIISDLSDSVEHAFTIDETVPISLSIENGCDSITVYDTLIVDTTGLTK
ncbi:PKD domain-containing protein [Candidatus Zixiibacteriota bacterium]